MSDNLGRIQLREQLDPYDISVISPLGVPARHVILLEHARVVDEDEGEDGADGGPGLREGAVVEEAGLAPAAAPAGDRHLRVGQDAHLQNPAQHLKERTNGHLSQLGSVKN